jgi:hypothetical protein
MENELSPELEIKYQAMKQFSATHDDLPDGAFLGMAKEIHGWDVDDWQWYAAEWERRKDSF